MGGGSGASGAELALDPDRLLPAEPRERAIARELYDATRELPVISPHGHVDPRLLLDDHPFPDPAALLITPDHYVTRLLHADGVGLDALGVAQGPLSEEASRAVWRRLCERWHLFRGTPVRLWLEAELAEIFGVSARPSAQTADAIYDELAARLAEDAYRPRALFERFGISVLATTDDPGSDLAVHAALAADPTWSGRVIPAFRPDRYLELAEPTWPDAVAALGEAARVEAGDYAGYLGALEARRRHFIERGATSADHAHPDARTDPLGDRQAARIYRAALAGEATADEAVAFRRHMIGEMARMSCEDGLVMTLHPGVRRSHHRPTFERFGADTGHDIPIRLELTDALRPLLERYG
ncbi:MAG TPA: glucuronate isomerase, partial [Thermoleophilaceae bacterium]